jgi:hypothetical protein
LCFLINRENISTTGRRSLPALPATGVDEHLDRRRDLGSPQIRTPALDDVPIEVDLAVAAHEPLLGRQSIAILPRAL